MLLPSFQRGSFFRGVGFIARLEDLDYDDGSANS